MGHESQLAPALSWDDRNILGKQGATMGNTFFDFPVAN